MAGQSYTYVIVGAGLAGASAAEGIREVDPKGSILLVGAEKDLPYDRPPLSKQLWKGEQKLEACFRHDPAFYEKAGVEVRLGRRITRIDPAGHTVKDNNGNTIVYKRLLLATGGAPRRLNIAGGDSEGVSYYRTMADFRQLHGQVKEGQSALVIGGGFIGSEMAAALSMNKLKVTLVFPADHLVSRVFPASLGKYLTEQYRHKGITVLAGEKVTSLSHVNNQFVAKTNERGEIHADHVVAGIGIVPETELAQSAKLEVGDGIVVNDHLQTSNPDIYAAGDNAFFPEAVLGRRRIEHWDNALNQGKQAGRNLAGANEVFGYMPFFFSDLFEFGYEAVGEVDSRLQVFADWKEENKTGVLYYLNDGKLRGAMMCNVWEKVDAARALIRKGGKVTEADLRGAIQ